MRRALILLSVLAALAFAAIWTADHPGHVALDWQGWRLEMATGTLIVLLLSGIALLFFAGRLWSWLRGGHPLSPERRAARRAKLGMRDVNQALVALAAGDVRRARRLAESAVKRTDGAAVAHVIAAQAAAAAGDETRAAQHFEALADNKDAKFLGLRGLIDQARQEGRMTEALRLADEARRAAPDSEWAAAAAFDLETAAGEWEKAEASLKRALALAAVTPDEADRHRAALRYGRAVAAEQKGDSATALKHAMAAHKLAPDFAPAILLAGRLLKAGGKAARAAKLIEQSWARAPHPSLAESYASLFPTETAEARMKRFERLAEQNPQHPESRLRLAEAYLGAGRPNMAREVLEPLRKGNIRARVGQLMSQVETATGGAAQARNHWADIAASGAPEPVWTCRNCGAERGRWRAHCASCGHFNSLVWDLPMGGRAPGREGVALVGGAQLLPKMPAKATPGAPSGGGAPEPGG